MSCAFDGCQRQAARGGYCWGHVQQQSRGQPLHELRFYGEPLTRLYEAAIRFYEVDEDDEHRAAADNLRTAALAYAWHVLRKQVRKVPSLSTLQAILRG